MWVLKFPIYRGSKNSYVNVFNEFNIFFPSKLLIWKYDSHSWHGFIEIQFSAPMNWKSKVELRSLTVWVYSPILQLWIWGSKLLCFPWLFDPLEIFTPLRFKFHGSEYFSEFGEIQHFSSNFIENQHFQLCWKPTALLLFSETVGVVIAI